MVATCYKLVQTDDMSNTVIPVWTLGDRLAKAREMAGISVQAMADQLKVARTTISNWEHDRVEVSRSVVIAYGLITGVPSEWLEGIYPGAMTVTDTYKSDLKSAA